MSTIAEQAGCMTQDEIVSLLIGALDGQRYLIDEQTKRIEVLEIQVKSLVKAVPSAGLPPDDGSNTGRHKLFKT